MKAMPFGIFVMLSLVLMFPTVNAQPYFAVYPTEGNVTTDIFLQIRGLPGTQFYEYYYLYIFWDDILLGVFPDNSGTYDHYFDTHFSPPNSGNYSALGNHTVYFEVWNAGRNAMFINATFVFTITEYLPCPEYVALNATYAELLSNYTMLLNNYNSLVANHSKLNNDYTSLSANYYELFDSYEGLNSTYDNLRRNYDSLRSSYDTLATSYNALIGELGVARNIGYIFITLTIILVATTIYCIKKIMTH